MNPLFTSHDAACLDHPGCLPLSLAPTEARSELRAHSCDVTRTTVVTLLAERKVVFNLLADLENLPRWAPEFCEAVNIIGGRWVGLTSCGELFLEVQADENLGEIALIAGTDARELRRFVLQLKDGDSGTTRIKFALRAGASEEATRIYSALESTLRAMVGRVEELIAWNCD